MTDTPTTVVDRTPTSWRRRAGARAALVLRLLRPPGLVGARGRLGPPRGGGGAGPAVRARLAARRPAAGRLHDRPRGCCAARTTATLVTHADLCASRHRATPTTWCVDAQGRAYVGNFGFDLMAGAPIETASLHRVDPDGTVTEVADDLWFPNGSAITPDGVLLVVETFGNRVSAFDLTDDGRLTRTAGSGPSSARCPTDRRRREGAARAQRRRRRRLPRRRGRAVDRRRDRRPAGAGDRGRHDHRRGPARAPRSTPAGSAAPTAGPCSCAPPPTSTPRPARPRPRPGCWRSGSTCRRPDEGLDKLDRRRVAARLSYLPWRMAACRSQLRREITSSGISLGQAAVHSPMLVQPPKPSWSCWATMLTTRLSRSAWPCGSSPRWVTLAPMNSEAEPFGQAATQAPQPMQVATSNARSALSLGTGVGVRVGGGAGVDRDVAAGLDDPVERAAVDAEVLDHRERVGAPRLDRDRRRRP